MTTKKPQVEVSVISCTRNRARQLATLFQCLGSQRDLEDIRWEIVIVDNNSTDNTKEVAYAFCEGSNLRVNYVFEPNTGLSYARNSGILASKGSLLLFIDDDVLIPPEFISNALFGVKEFPEFGIFGFRVLPEWRDGTKAPFWLSFKKSFNLPVNLIQSFLPVHDLGPEPLQYPNRITKNPIGASFLIKKEVFEKLGPFREDLGAGQSGVCEDTEYFWYAMMNDFKILYWPYAALYHTVDPRRLSVGYLHKWYFNLGKSLYLIKSNGRIHKENNGENAELKSSNPEFEKLTHALNTQHLLLSNKIFKIPIFLIFKLLIIILLLPTSILLLFINKPFYLSTMLAKTLGEIKQAVNIK